MHLIYGSQAIKYFFEDFNRIPNDLDIIDDDITKESSKEVQYYWTEAFDFLRKNNKNNTYVDPDFLYTIKVSHAAWDINWEKTIKDINFLQNKGCKINKGFYDLLYKDWIKIHDKKHIKMNVKNSEFFKETIYRKYNHEELHLHFAFYDRPMNEKIRKDLDSPLCSLSLWEKLSQSDKIKCALEEIFVLTTERYIAVQKPLPNKIARVKTMKQMITSTTSGWFNLFLIINFEKLRTSSQDYFENKLKLLK